MAPKKTAESRRQLIIGGVTLLCLIAAGWFSWNSLQTVANAKDNRVQDEKLEALDGALAKIDKSLEDILQLAGEIKQEQEKTNLKLVNLKDNVDKHETADIKRDEKAEERIYDLERKR
ncbi:MAG: hypothetical protein KAT70_07745 [Thermoplasmata archaeon]|nr:hypothetical protein [Thermoplasmata archaeon]